MQGTKKYENTFSELFEPTDDVCAEKQRRYCEKKEQLKEKDELRKRLSRQKFKKDFPLLHQEKVRDESQGTEKIDRKLKITKTL